MDDDRADTSNPNPSINLEVTRLVNVAREAWEGGKLVDSEAPLHRALQLVKETLGSEHPLAAWVHSHLGWLASARGQQEEAVGAYRQALSIQKARLGESHPDTLQAMEDLATVLVSADARSEEADELALSVIAAYESAGRDDTALATLFANVAQRRYQIGRHVMAEPLFVRALAMRERLLGANNHATADTALRLALLYERRGFDVDPEPYFRKALVGFEKAVGGDHVDAAAARFRLASFLYRQGREEEAEPLFKRLIATLMANGAAFAPERFHWMIRGCCKFLRETGRSSEAEALREWAGPYDPVLIMTRSEVERTELVFGGNSPQLAEALGHLAYACSYAGLVEEAEDAAHRSLTILESQLEPDSSATAEAATRLAVIREKSVSAAVEEPIHRHLYQSSGKLFEAFSFPWRDERRSDLIRAYLTAVGDQDADDRTGAIGAIVALTFTADLDEQWGVILELIDQAPDDARVLQDIAAGPLEGLLGRFDDAAIDRVEEQAACDPRFRRILSGVWKHGMSDPTWDRVRAIQASVPNPLPSLKRIVT